MGHATLYVPLALGLARAYIEAAEIERTFMDHTAIHIRRATLDDRETITDFNAAMAVESESKLLDRDTLSAGVDAALGDPGKCLYFVGEMDGRIVGQTMVTFEWSDWRNGVFWWIQSVYVAPSFRRRGVFKALHQHIRELARGDPAVCGLRLYVHKDNHRAIGTYESLGMELSPYLVCEEDWSAQGR